VGLQAQAPLAPYAGLHARLERFDPAELATALERRELVRIALMRSTIHLVTARDCLELRALIQPVLDRQLWGGSQWGKRLPGIDREALAAAGRAVLDERPRGMPELGAALHERFPAFDAASLAHAVRNLVPLVQLPPRGVWGRGGRLVLATAETWLGAPLASSPSLEAMVRRYLGAYGPASVQDAQTWAGLPRLGDVFERLREELAIFADEDGRTLYDLPDAPRPDPATPAPPRLIPEYDNLLLSHALRARVIASEHRERVFTRGALLVDGFVRGAWKLARTGKAVTLELEEFAPIPKRHRAGVERETERLLALVTRP
jgi:hypothetical protein